EGAIHHSEAPKFGTMLAEEICKVTGHQFLLVLDDLHLIERSMESAALLSSLIQHTPSWMQWVLVSRHSVKKVLGVDHFNIPSLRVENTELDFSLEESAQLYQSIFGLALPLEEIQQLQRQTEGWITGLVLAGLHMDKTEKLGTRKECFIAPPDIRSRLGYYFLQDALAEIPQERFRKIFQLVLLEDMPLPLLHNLFGRESAEELIRELEGNNHFFRCIDDDRAVYNFHHLFRDSLLPLAEQELSIQSQKLLFRQAVQYHLGRCEPLRALHYVVRCGDIPLCEDILSQFGFELLYLNQTRTLYRILKTFPKETISNYPWLSYYYGTCRQDSFPSEALPFLINAQALFADQKNELGLLLANSQLVEFHIIIDGQFNLMAGYLADLEDVFSRRHMSLSLPLQLKIAHALALGHCFLQMDIKKVEQFDSMALRLSKENRLDNMTASVQLIRAYRHGFIGNWKGCFEEVEASFKSMVNPRVSTLGKLFLQMLQVNLLEMTGDFVNYRDQKRTLEQGAEQDLLLQSVIGPFLHIWDIDSALAKNDIDTAERIVNKGLQSSYAATKAHMRSQLLHYHAFILALQQKKKEALETIEKSLELRQKVGGNAFIILNYQILGAAFAQLGMVKEAEDFFNRAMIISDKIGDEFQRISIYAHRAWLRLQSGETPEVLKDVEQCLRHLTKKKCSHFFSFMPNIMEPILELAICHNIEPDYAQKLLSKKLHKGVDKNLGLIPLLDIRLLSDLMISSTDGRQSNIHELTENERRFLYIIIASPGLQITQSLMSLHCWPEKSPDRQRSSLDVLVSRLRKRLSLLVSPVKPMEYLAVEQGIVKLKNCRIDVLQFLQHAKQGRTHARQGEMWQAGNSFHHAFRLWGETGFTGLKVGNIDLFHENVEHEFVHSSKVWASLLVDQGKNGKASQVLETAFRFFPQDMQLARQCYDLYARSGRHNHAQNVLRYFKNAHQQLSEDPQDVEEAVAAFWDICGPEEKGLMFH
ncbi:MAG TPA: hypothetical protein ENJ30_10455, partial [Desulfobulbaceae bacterium]|nr:hypothetical protein [Desulfobulbaceae bacterium]